MLKLQTKLEVSQAPMMEKERPQFYARERVLRGACWDYRNFKRLLNVARAL